MDLQKIKPLIGNTPLIRINYSLDGEEGSVYSKLEYYNFSGSIKDRMAFGIIEDATLSGALSKGQPIVEMTSGNTGIAFAALGAMLGHPVHIFMPQWASEERKGLMRMYGAVLHLVSYEEGGFMGALEGARLAVKELGAFAPLQFENPANPGAHYSGTGTEILSKLPNVTDFVAGVGSGGTLMGVARRLKKEGHIRSAAVEPDVSAPLSGGITTGTHMIEGIGDGFIPPLVDKSLIDGVWAVNDGDSVSMAARLGRELGLGVGISSGANFLAAVMQKEKYKGTVATVFSDDSKKYLSTSLANPPIPQNSSLASRIKLLSFEAL